MSGPQISYWSPVVGWLVVGGRLVDGFTETQVEPSDNSDSNCCIPMYKECDDIITFPKTEPNESSLNRTES